MGEDGRGWERRMDGWLVLSCLGRVMGHGSWVMCQTGVWGGRGRENGRGSGSRWVGLGRGREGKVREGEGREGKGRSRTVSGSGGVKALWLGVGGREGGGCEGESGYGGHGWGWMEWMVGMVGQCGVCGVGRCGWDGMDGWGLWVG